MEAKLLAVFGDDIDVVNAARVSFDKRVDKEYHKDGSLVVLDKDQKLIKYLAKHKHWTPFAHCFLRFKVKAPIFVARQLIKHQVGLVWNEVSRRYVDDTPEIYIPQLWRKRHESAKQGSSDETFDPMGPQGYNLVEIYTSVVKEALSAYQALLDRGVAPEQARMVLPQSMYTEWYWSGSLYAFARVCTERLHPSGQKETRFIAKQIYEKMLEAFPVSTPELLANIEVANDIKDTTDENFFLTPSFV